MYKLGFK